ncbi:uncharacterized protein ACNS7B_005149 [Menidia menidia]
MNPWVQNSSVPFDYSFFLDGVAALLASNLLLGLPANAFVLCLMARPGGGGGGAAAEPFALSLAAAELLGVFSSLPVLLRLLQRREVPLAMLLLKVSLQLMLVSRPLLQTCICLERYLAVVHPTLFLRLRPLRYRLLVLAVDWLLILLDALVPLLAPPPQPVRPAVPLQVAAVPGRAELLRPARAAGAAAPRPVRRRRRAAEQHEAEGLQGHRDHAGLQRLHAAAAGGRHGPRAAAGLAAAPALGHHGGRGLQHRQQRHHTAAIPAPRREAALPPLLSPGSGPAVRYSCFPPAGPAPPPLIGQHTVQVLRDALSYGDDLIRALLDSGAVAQNEAS